MAQTVKMLFLIGLKGDAGAPKIACFVPVIPEACVKGQLAFFFQQLSALPVIHGFSIPIELGAHTSGFQYSPVLLLPDPGLRLAGKQRPILIQKFARGGSLEADTVFPAGRNAHNLHCPHKTDLIIYNLKTHFRNHLAFLYTQQYSILNYKCICRFSVLLGVF